MAVSAVQYAVGSNIAALTSEVARLIAQGYQPSDAPASIRGYYVQKMITEASKLVDLTAATATITAATAGRTHKLNRALGIAIALPAATGSGNTYRFVVGTTASGGTGYAITATGGVFRGVAVQAADGGNTVAAYEATSTDNTILLDGSTQGGIVGDFVEVIDIAAGVYHARVIQAATGTEASPFETV